MIIFCVVSYKGTNYKGWERQNNAISIQETIENALFKLYGHKISIFASGRTDAGVHALGQTFHFEIEEQKYAFDDLKYRMNCLLPKDIAILSVQEKDASFHSRFSALGKVYEYRLFFDEKNPFLYQSACLYKEKIDMNLFKKALSLFVGEHNFQDFTSKEEDQNNFVRRIDDIKVIQNQEYGQTVVSLTGNGFMRYQVRFILGTALAVGSGKEKLDFVSNHLRVDKLREIVNYKAPSEGLYLQKVLY